MTDLSLFQEGKMTDTSIFEGDSVPSIDSEATSSEVNVSAQAALLSQSEDKLSTFQQLKNMPKDNRRAAVQNIKSEHAQGEAEQLVNTFSSMMVDGSLDEESSLSATAGLPALINQEKSSLQTLAEKFVTTPRAEESVLEQENQLSLASQMADFDKIVEEKQKVINLFLYNEDGSQVSLKNNWGDLLEALTPFMEQKLHADIKNALDENDPSYFVSLISSTLLGESKVGIKEDRWLNATSEEKLTLLRAIPKAVSESSGILFPNDNQLLWLDSVMTLVDSNYYGTLDRLLDDVAGALDTIGLGWTIKGAASSARVARLSKAATRTFRARKQPASPRAVAEQTNAREARDLHTAEMVDETGELSEVISGTGQTEAAVDAVAPQVRTEDQSVESVPHALDADLLKISTAESGRVERSASELEATAQKVLDQEFLEKAGLVQSPQLSTAPRFNPDTGRIEVNSVLTKGLAPFSNPVQAINETLLKLRHYGVGEGDLTLLRKNADGEYVPTTLAEIAAKDEIRETLKKKKQRIPEELHKKNLRDDYAVRVNYEYDPSAMSVVREDLEVVGNIFERSSPSIKGAESTPSRWVMPAQAMLSKVITGGASAAIDQTGRLQKALAKKAEPLLKLEKGLPKKEREMVDQLLFEQSLQRRFIPENELREAGLGDDGVKAMKLWREVNDQFWHLANLDLLNHYKNKGFSLYLDKELGESYLVKPINLNMAKAQAKAYNPATGKTVTLTPEELESLYESGGTMSKFRTTENLDGQEVDYIVTHSTDSNRSVRALTNEDKLLNYVKGHSYTVRYTDPWFIETYKVDAKGVEIKGSAKAFLTAENLKSAQAAVERFTQSLVGPSEKSSSVKYRYRPNSDLNIDEVMDKRFDVMEATGLTSQRKRGEMIPSYRDGDVDSQFNIQSPLESMKVTIRELGNRIPMRQYLDDLEARWVGQYGEISRLGRNEFGRYIMPRSLSDLKPPHEVGEKVYADAKSTLEFYNMIKYGYHNSLDKLWRSSFNNLATMVGRKSSVFESILRAVPQEVPSPTGFLRGMAFNYYIAAAMPSSQWLVQGVPALANAFIHPKYVFSGGMAADSSLLTLGIISKKAPKIVKKLMPEAEYAKMQKLAKEWDESGLGAGIDRHLIVESGLESMIESTRFATGKAAYNAVFDRARAAGFDVGEYINLSSYWLGVRNDAIKAGKDLKNPRVKDEVKAKVRDLTLNMNKAGEMPWNKNSLSVLTQFMISPYKGLTVFLNKGLSKEEKVSLATWNLLMMPLPGVFTYNLRSNFDVSPEMADAISNGLGGAFMNMLAKSLYGDNTSVSFERLNQFGFDVPWELVHGLLSDEFFYSLANSPSLSLFAGRNPVLSELVKNVAKVIVSPFQGLGDEEVTERMDAMTQSFFQATALGRSLSTGYRELWLKKYSDRYNGLGFVAKSNLTTPEALSKTLFGLESSYEAVMRRANTSAYYQSEEWRNDVKAFVRETNRSATYSGYNIDDPEREEYMNRMFLEAFPEGSMPPEAAKMVGQLFASSFKKGYFPVATQLTKASEMLGPEEALKMARALKDLDPVASEMYDWLRSEQTLAEMKEFTDE